MSDFAIIAAHPGYFGLFYDPENHSDKSDPRMARAIIAWKIGGDFVVPIAVDGPMSPDAIVDPRGIIETHDATFESFREWAASF